jgi:hypothetical protein
MVQALAFLRDGFQLKAKIFTMPPNPVELPPKTKRAMTICNLFMNHSLSVADIERVLDEDGGKIVRELIKHGILYDRRQVAGPPPGGTERRFVES